MVMIAAMPLHVLPSLTDPPANETGPPLPDAIRGILETLETLEIFEIFEIFEIQSIATIQESHEAQQSRVTHENIGVIMNHRELFASTQTLNSQRAQEEQRCRTIRPVALLMVMVTK